MAKHQTISHHISPDTPECHCAAARSYRTAAGRLVYAPAVHFQSRPARFRQAAFRYDRRATTGKAKG